MDALEASRRREEEMKAMLKAVVKKQAEFDVCSNILFYIQLVTKLLRILFCNYPNSSCTRCYFSAPNMAACFLIHFSYHFAPKY